MSIVDIGRRRKWNVHSVGDVVSHFASFVLPTRDCAHFIDFPPASNRHVLYRQQMCGWFCLCVRARVSRMDCKCVCVCVGVNVCVFVFKVKSQWKMHDIRIVI